MRVFAGHNGSGKTTIIDAIRQQGYELGIYINADDITQKLLNNSFDFSHYRIPYNKSDFRNIALASGLVRAEFSKTTFFRSYSNSGSRLQLRTRKYADRLAGNCRLPKKSNAP